MKELKPKITEKISKFQIGAIPGHRPQEHIYTIKSVIGHYVKNNKGIILTLYDVAKFFDREMLRDCCNELYKLNIKGKLYRLVYQLNRDAKITVRTPVGYTEYAEVEEHLGQGTNESGVISSVSLSGGVDEYFEDSNDEVNYLGLELAPCLYQDDIGRLAEDLKSVQAGNIRLEMMADSKLLDYNKDKSGMIIFGNKKFQRKIEKENSRNPVTFCKEPMKIFKSERYLGEFLGSSLSESVFQTIIKRKGIVNRIISEIKVTLEDCRTNTIGGMFVGMEIWNKAIVPFLFGNSECWIDMPKKALNLVSSMVRSFFRSLFFAPKGTPIFCFYWDTGSLLEENFIILKKLLFLHHLANLPSNALANNIYVLQKEHPSESGLVQECNEYMSKLDITLDPGMTSKNHWRKLILHKIHQKNKSDLLSLLESYKKLDRNKFEKEEYGQKSYLKTMTISQSRTFFSARSMMLTSVQWNFKSDPAFAANEYKCECGDLDTQANLLTCRLYEHLREGLDLAGSDTDLVKYYQLVISERQKEDT